jgi:hypothetical protein
MDGCGRGGGIRRGISKGQVNKAGEISLTQPRAVRQNGVGHIQRFAHMWTCTSSSTLRVDVRKLECSTHPYLCRQIRNAPENLEPWVHFQEGRMCRGRTRGGGRNQVCNEGFTDLVRSIGLVLTIIGKIYYWVRPVRVCAIVGRRQNKPVGGKYSIAIPRASTCLKPTVNRGVFRSACTGPILRKLGNPLVSGGIRALDTDQHGKRDI